MIDKEYRKFLEEHTETDAAHNIAHIKRVVKNAQTIHLEESGDKEIVMAAAWLHDCVILPKNHSDRKKGLQLWQLRRQPNF